MNCEKIMGGDKRNHTLPEKYANKPNLFRVAFELSTFRDPYKAADMLLAVAGPAVKQGEDRKGSGMNRNERFNHCLNNCKRPELYTPRC